MKISLHAIVRILTENKEVFAIHSAPDSLFGDGIIKLLLPHGNSLGTFTYDKDYQTEVVFDRSRPRQYQVGMHYNLNNQQVISICQRWLDLIKKNIK